MTPGMGQSSSFEVSGGSFSGISSASSATRGLRTRARNLLPVAELLVFGALGPCRRWLVLLFAGSVKMLVLQENLMTDNKEE
jgi:hypothetical protein